MEKVSLKVFSGLVDLLEAVKVKVNKFSLICSKIMLNKYKSSAVRNLELPSVFGFKTKMAYLTVTDSNLDLIIT